MTVMNVMKKVLDVAVAGMATVLPPTRRAICLVNRSQRSRSISWTLSV